MRRALSAVIGAVSLAAVVAGTSVTAASASVTTVRTEHFQFVSVSASSNRDSAIGWGVFTAGGTINLNSGHVRFPGGTFRAIHHRTSMSAELNRRTCLLVSVGHGTYRLTHGTGRYRHIRGLGTYTSRVRAVLGPQCPGPLLTVEAAAGLPADRQRPRAGQRRVRDPDACPVGNAGTGLATGHAR